MKMSGTSARIHQILSIYGALPERRDGGSRSIGLTPSMLCSVSMSLSCRAGAYKSFGWKSESWMHDEKLICYALILHVLTISPGDA